MEKKVLLFEGEHIDEVNDDISLIQRDSGLKLGTDALLLASYIRTQASASAIELGGGSGIISLLCAARKKLGYISCVEIQEKFASIIERNIELNGLSERVKCLCADIRDLKNHISEECDVVFSNPPYMTTGGAMNESDEKTIARHEIFGTIADFCTSASQCLKYGGLFYCVYRPDRLSDLMFNLRKNGLEPKRMTFVHANYKSIPSMVLLEAKKGAKCGCNISEPFFIYKDEENKIFSDKMKEIYEKGSF
ncbi:MAG: methyltransferase [Clostridia bacterium]|nr:methyltransferase [Clostridia bacterium]